MTFVIFCHEQKKKTSYRDARARGKKTTEKHGVKELEIPLDISGAEAINQVRNENSVTVTPEGDCRLCVAIIGVGVTSLPK